MYRSKYIIPIIFLATMQIFCGPAHSKENVLCPNRTYTVQKGDSLCKIAEKFYGNCHLSSAIMYHNNIRNKNNSYTDIISIGDILKVPDLVSLLKREGLSKVAEKEIELINDAWLLYLKNEEQLINLHQSHYKELKVSLPNKISKDLSTASKKIDVAISGLKIKKEAVKELPLKTIGQLECFGSGLKVLSEGHNDSYGYDFIMIHKNFGYAIEYIIVWSRNNFE